MTGHSECGKSVCSTKFLLYNINEYNKVYIYSLSLHQDLYQKINKCFSNYMPIHVIPNILNEKDIDIVIEEIVNYKNFQKSDIEIETYESVGDVKLPQEYEDGCIIILDNLNEKEMIDPPVHAMFKMSRHNNLSIFIISQENYELPKRTKRANINNYHIFKPNNFRDVQNLYQDKASMDMKLNEFKNLTNNCWKENYQPLTIDMTKDRYQGRYLLGINSVFVPDSSPF